MTAPMRIIVSTSEAIEYFFWLSENTRSALKKNEKCFLMIEEIREPKSR
tara:strand:+ start:99 stop:245 length:147 start_codon:yes stop_codon:yes gene_type:complete